MPYDGEKIVHYVTAGGMIRFVEGKAQVPLSVAQKLVEDNPKWLIEPVPKLKKEKE